MTARATARRALEVLDARVARRCAETVRERADRGATWPCHAGCDDCCRSLAEVPTISEAEGLRLRDAVAALSASSRARVLEAVAARRAAGDERPVVCPLLGDDGLCSVYDARPVACRTYGFYADREGVLGCRRIADVASTDEPVVWGNHASIDEALDALGPRRSLLDWVEDRAVSAAPVSSADRSDP